ncbi:ABC-type transport auxiliary lipoprotein family protein [Paucibacter sp. AS339]|uniref:ABC-type transport auxiliary lipoprotein family protein n=1 Tax=Paucibacter hankyongi TaxID=3133434 RepID=UPI0030A0F487
MSPASPSIEAAFLRSHDSRPLSRWASRVALLVLLALGACAFNKAEPMALYDLGPAPAPAQGRTPSRALPPVQLIDVSAPSWLASAGIAYRLDYADPLRREIYRDSRWAAPPAALLAERLRQRLAAEQNSQAQVQGGATLPLPLPLPLRLELEEFGQSFATPNQSQVRIRLRARLGEGANARLQVFDVQGPAESADAPGAVRALNQASERLIEQMLDWLAQLPR